MFNSHNQTLAGSFVKEGDSVPISHKPRRPRSSSPVSERNHQFVGAASTLRIQAPTPALKLAETTVAGVQSALNRRAIQVGLPIICKKTCFFPQSLYLKYLLFGCCQLWNDNFRCMAYSNA